MLTRLLGRKPPSERLQGLFPVLRPVCQLIGAPGSLPVPFVTLWLWLVKPQGAAAIIPGQESKGLRGGSAALKPVPGP